MVKLFKPQLLSNDEFNPEDLDYTDMMLSPKFDGVRFEIKSDGVYSRSMKLIPNEQIQKMFKPVCDTLRRHEVLEGEFWSPKFPCREIAGLCNRSNAEVHESYNLWLFDYTQMPSDSFKFDLTHFQRREVLSDHFDKHDLKSHYCMIIPEMKVNNAEEAVNAFKIHTSNKQEGVVMFDNRKTYKYGRVTVKQGIGFKMKPHKEEDLLILDVTERMMNLNESTKDELGHSTKRNTVDAKRGTGIAGTFICKYNDTTTKVTITGTEAERREIWNNKTEYINKYVITKSMDYQSKDKPRHGRMVGIKESLEK